MNNELRQAIIGARLGGKQLRRWEINAVARALAQGEAVLAVLPCDNDKMLCATDSRAFAASRDGVGFETPYSSIAEIDVSTGWFSRGISITTDGGSVFSGGGDSEALEAMAGIIREMTPHLDGADPEESKGGGLTGLAKGVFNTATGGDIRKYEEFVDAATTVLVGLHQDQYALTAKLGEFDEAIAELRESDRISRERIANLAAAVAELQTAQSDTMANLAALQDTLNALADEVRAAQSIIQSVQAAERARSSASATMVKAALAASGVAAALAVVSIALGFM